MIGQCSADEVYADNRHLQCQLNKVKADCAHLSACLTDERTQNKKLVAEMELLDKEIERLNDLLDAQHYPL